MATMSFEIRIHFNENMKSENKTKHIKPISITSSSLKRIILAIQKVTKALENGDCLYFVINELASTIYDEYYLEYTYDEFLEDFKEEFNDIFLKNEMDGLEVLCK